MRQKLSFIRDIEALRHYATVGLLWFVGLHTPAIALIGWLLGNPQWAMLTAVSAILSIAGWLTALGSNRLLVQNTLAVTLMGQVMLVVAALKGQPYQVDAHMYFFACLGVLAIFIRPSAILFATLAVAVHHLVLYLLVPVYVFPGSSSLWRVVMHAGILLLEAGVLLALCQLVSTAFTHAVQAQGAAEEALKQARDSQHERDALTERGREERKQMLSQMASDFEASVKALIDNVSASIADLAEHAGDMADAAREAKDKAAQVARTAGEASATTQNVAAASEELSQSIRSISGQVQLSTRVTTDAAGLARDVSSAMNGLLGQIDKVNQVTGFITTVAAQINLLALNATIESARAGEAGRGFAVVAGEVKNLAGQTSKASDEIVQQIADMQRASQDAEKRITTIVSTINSIDSAMQSIASAIEQQSRATGEIAQNVEQSSDHARSVSSTIADVEQGAELTRQSSDDILRATEHLRREAQTLERSVASFLATLRAA